MIERQDRSPAKGRTKRVLNAIGRKWWLAWLAVALAWPGYYIVKEIQECDEYEREQSAMDSGPPYKRYEPICWWDRGSCRNPLHRVSGELTPDFFEAVRQKLSPDWHHVVDGVIYIRRFTREEQEARRPGMEHEVGVWNLTSETVVDILRKRWNLSEHADISTRLEAEGYLSAGTLTCEAVRKIAIQPSP